jgi:hypothetical protein
MPIDCLILGDSIAFGVAHFRPECVAYAHEGWNSNQWNNAYANKDISLTARVVVISLGSNDYEGIESADELAKLRSKVHGRKVYWILPAIKPEVQDMVKALAAKHKDQVLVIKNIESDGIHPTWPEYEALANQTRGIKTP